MINIVFHTDEGGGVRAQWPCVPRRGERVDLDGLHRRVVDVRYVYEVVPHVTSGASSVGWDGPKVTVHIKLGDRE